MQNMAELFGKFNEFQEKMNQLKEELARTEVEAEAGGGMVKVKANGNKEIVGIKLDKDIVDPDDMEMLEDLIVAGVNKALKEAERLNKEKMSELTKNLLPGGLGGIPGIDPGSLGF
jgi:DNA-binding YbaB/EbfC family protein